VGAWCERDGSRAWAGALGLAVGIGCAYFVAARIGLTLLTKTEGVADFWPASGLATGALLVLGLRARACVAAGILAATVAANLLAERDLPTAVALGGCNAGEALLAAWLVERWSGPQLKFDALRGLWGFLAAAALAPAVAAVGAAAVMQPLHPDASLLGVWRMWAAADALGIVTIAPLAVGLFHLARERTPREETIEGAAALAVLAATSAGLYTAHAGSWVVCGAVSAAAVDRGALPAGVRGGRRLHHLRSACRCCDLPSRAVCGRGHTRAQRTGHDARRLLVRAQPGCAVCRAASQRGCADGQQRATEAGFGGAKLGVWGVDLASGAFESDPRDSRINGHDLARPPRTLGQVRKFVHPADLPRLDAAFSAARRTGTPCQAEYRVRVNGGPKPAQVRWVAVEGSVVRDGPGRPARLLGVTRDITERKLAEGQKDLLLAELDHRVKNALAVVAAVASRTQETSGSLAEFVAALDGRIKSMATTHELLSCRKWQGIKLAELIERELEPYATGRNVSIGGPDVVLQAEAGQAMAMAVHELVTNAAKYGALSVEPGRVAVCWAYGGENGSGSALVLDWVETNGPPVVAGARRGYGTSVIRDLVPYELDGAVDLTLAPQGVCCRLTIPAKWVSGSDRPPRGLDSAGAPPARARRNGATRTDAPAATD
jgi:two-component sensor histidine kinase/PAS domain-containing protein